MRFLNVFMSHSSNDGFFLTSKKHLGFGNCWDILDEISDYQLVSKLITGLLNVQRNMSVVLDAACRHNSGRDRNAASTARQTAAHVLYCTNKPNGTTVLLYDHSRGHCGPAHSTLYTPITPVTARNGFTQIIN